MADLATPMSIRVAASAYVHRVRPRILDRPRRAPAIATLVRRPDELAIPGAGAADRAPLRLEPLLRDPRRRRRRWHHARRDPARPPRPARNKSWTCLPRR